MAYDGLSDSLKTELIENFKINQLGVEDIFTRTQLSKVELRKKYLYISIHFPEFNLDSKKFDIKELHFIINNQFFIFIYKDDLKLVKKFLHNLNNLPLQNFSPTSLFYEILDYLITDCFKTLAKFRNAIDKLEVNLFDFVAGENELKEILIAMQNLITFKSTINPIKDNLIDLQTKHKKFVDDESLEFADDTLDKVKKILNNLDIFEKQMKILMTTNESIIRRETNDNIKYLTTINLLIAVPTFISNFFGINVYFGWKTDESFIPVILIFITSIVATILVYLYYKNKNLI